MDIVVIPEGELGDDYKKKNEQLDSLREECTSLLFTDALNGDGANSERIAQLISDYKTLQAECDEMYNKFIEPYRAKSTRPLQNLKAERTLLRSCSSIQRTNTLQAATVTGAAKPSAQRGS